MIAAVLAVPSTQYRETRTNSREDSGGWLCRVGLLLLATRYWVLLSLPRHDADVRQIAVALGVIESVAHDEFVRDGKTNIVALQRQLAT